MESLERAPLISIAESEDFQLYSRRWFILALYALIYIANSMQMQQYVSITEIMVIYYNVSISDVNWSELVYFLEFVIFTLPSIFIIENLGLRRTVLICAIGTALAAWIKVASVNRNRYWVVIIGQAVNGIFCFMLTIISPKIASKWFGSKEISSACGIGITSSAVSLAIGFLIPTSVVNPESFDTIERSLYIMNLCYAAVPTLLIPVLFLYFYDNPPTPPTKTQRNVKKEKISLQKYCQSTKKLLRNFSFLCIAFIYIINMAFFNSLSTLLNPIMTKYYPNSTVEIGYVGCIINISDIFAVILIWFLLDKFKLFKLTAWLSSLLCLVTTASFLCFFSKGIHLAYCLSALCGCFSNAMALVMVEIGIEVTYPESEITLYAIFEIGAQLIGIVFTYLYTYLLENFNGPTINLIFLLILSVADTFLIFVKYDLKRQAALKL